VPASYADAADERVGVPLYGRAESLNVSIATALCLYASAQAQREAGLPDDGAGPVRH
jgi:TrmH family RNA methyltransferase